MQHKPIIEHSAGRVGHVWTTEDHEHLARTMRKIDATVQGIYNLNREAPPTRVLAVSRADVDALLAKRGSHE